MASESRIADELRRGQVTMVRQTQAANKEVFHRVLEQGLASEQQSQKQSSHASGRKVVEAALASGNLRPKQSGPVKRKGSSDPELAALIELLDTPRAKAQAAIQEKNPAMAMFSESVEMMERGQILNILYLAMQQHAMKFDRQFALWSVTIKDHGDTFRGVLKNVAY